MPRNIYSPVRDGFVQENYFDQMATAAVGQLANASDHNLVDSAIVGAVGDDGLVAGFGVVSETIANVARSGINQFAVNLPADDATAALLAAITVRNDQMSSNTAGRPCWFEGSICNILRLQRVGGRIWLALSNGSTSANASAYWIIADSTGHGKPIGSFSAEALGVDTVAIPWLKFRGVFAAPSSGLTAALAEIVVNEAYQ